MSVYYALNGQLKKLTLDNIRQILVCFQYPYQMNNLLDLEREFSETMQTDESSSDLHSIAYRLQYGESIDLDTTDHVNEGV